MSTSTRVGSGSGTGNGNGNGGTAYEREAGASGTSARKEIFGIVERNESSFWTRIGVAFENRDGSWFLKFDYIPIRPEIKLQLREPREPRERDERG